MRVTTIEEARELVGRTFERDGVFKTIVRVTETPRLKRFRVQYEHRHEEDRRVTLMWATGPVFRRWLSGATEVTQ